LKECVVQSPLVYQILLADFGDGAGDGEDEVTDELEGLALAQV